LRKTTPIDSAPTSKTKVEIKSVTTIPPAAVLTEDQWVAIGRCVQSWSLEKLKIT